MTGVPEVPASDLDPSSSIVSKVYAQAECRWCGQPLARRHSASPRGSSVRHGDDPTVADSDTGAPSTSHSTAALGPCQRTASDRREAGPATRRWASNVVPAPARRDPLGEQPRPGGDAALDDRDRRHVVDRVGGRGLGGDVVERGIDGGQVGERPPLPRRSEDHAGGRERGRAERVAPRRDRVDGSRDVGGGRDRVALDRTRRVGAARRVRAGAAPARSPASSRPPSSSSHRAARTASTSDRSGRSRRLATSVRVIQPRTTASSDGSPVGSAARAAITVRQARR